ncbi:MAG TPA: acetate kinase [Actinocrinis sp.]|nr:acetate kinase [Actinocrinis sp.]
MQRQAAGEVLVLNTGSSSIKYRLIDPVGGRRLVTGLVERIGEEGDGRLVHHPDGAAQYVETRHFAGHEAAVAAVLDAFARHGPDLEARPPVAIGHRVVHGGARFTAPTLVDDEVAEAIEELSPLAPLHTPANLAGIQIARMAFPTLPHIAVFDTAFHQTLPPHAYTYAVPHEWREQFGVRRYGFHGISFRYVSRRAAALLGRDLEELNLIVLHLGNGASACAISAGQSVETSMGLTPMEGLVMGTRSGDLDPAIPEYLERVAGLDGAAVDRALNHESGLRALAGDNDLRDVFPAVDRGDPAARLAIDVYCHRIRKYVGAYYAVLGRVDAVVFTAGVGEHAPRIRADSLTDLGRLGIRIQRERNNAPSHGERFISPPGAEVPVLVVPTDEEAEIAAQTLAAIRQPQGGG